MPEVLSPAILNKSMPSTAGATIRIYQLLAVPVAVFEIILLPFWLFYRGFKTPEAPEHPVAE